MKKIDVIGIGALNYDLLLKVDRILAKEDEICADEEHYSPGGSAANTIYGLAKLGLKTGFVGCLGKDMEGREIIRNFNSVGVCVKGIKILENKRTGLALALVDRSGRRALYILPRANNFLTHINLNYIKNAKLLHLTSFANLKQFELQKKIVEKLPNLEISFAPGALYTRLGLKCLLPIISKCSIIFLNYEELKMLTRKNYLDGCDKIISSGCKTVVVTLGEKGCYIAEATGKHHIKAIKTKVLDLTGAGDAFAAGFLYGYLKRKCLEECGKLGNIVASFCISKFGAREGLPSKKEIKKFLLSKKL
ncbi:MAG: carbohydrate kinase family protein [Candidatus Thermoplasmatota archaeon]|nr:carbohydrate kinase family protein [Candidatus Thermoplasmatota archaeon]